MNKNIIKRKLWTLSKCRCIGYIESIHKTGIIFPTDYIKFHASSIILNDIPIHIKNYAIIYINTNNKYPDTTKTLDYYINTGKKS